MIRGLNVCSRESEIAIAVAERSRWAVMIFSLTAVLQMSESTIAFSSDVDTGWREENASKKISHDQGVAASILRSGFVRAVRAASTTSSVGISRMQR